MSDTSNLALPYLAPGQAQKHVTVNETLRRLDAIVQLAVVSATTSAEPSSPADGAVYIVPSGKSGANWAAFSNWALGYYRDGAWEQVAPREGWIAFVKDTDQLLYYTGSAWSLFPAAKILTVSASDKVLGRSSSGAGAAEEIALTAAGRALIDDADAAAQRATLSAAGTGVSNTFSQAQAISAGGTALALGPGGTGSTPALYLRLDLGSGGGYGGFQIRTNGTQKFLWYYDVSADESRWATSLLDPAITLPAAGHLRPGSDNGQTLGDGSHRWSTVYAGTGTINTSDAREKTALRAPSRAERAAMRRLMQSVGVYQWLASIDAKGADAARLHVGVTAQAAREAFEAEGLDAAAYGLYCADPLGEPEEGSEERGESLMRLGVRYDQIFAMALAVLFTPEG